MNPKQSNFARLEAEGLIVPDYKFSEEDRRALESLSEEEVTTIIRMVHKLAPNWPKSHGPVRGIIL